jgi:hypothetical protein
LLIGTQYFYRKILADFFNNIGGNRPFPCAFAVNFRIAACRRALVSLARRGANFTEEVVDPGEREVQPAAQVKHPNGSSVE